MQARCLSSDEPDDIRRLQPRQLNLPGAKPVLEELTDERYVVDDRGRSEQPLLPKIPLELLGASLDGGNAARGDRLSCDHSLVAQIASELPQSKRIAAKHRSSPQAIS